MHTVLMYKLHNLNNNNNMSLDVPFICLVPDFLAAEILRMTGNI